MKRQSSFHLIAIISPIIALTGCWGELHGAGAMRIEVDVYKGPLSHDPEIQWGELIGYVKETKRTLLENANFTIAIAAGRGFPSPHTEKGNKEYFKTVELEKLLKPTSQGKESPEPESYLYIPFSYVQPRSNSLLEMCNYQDPVGSWDEIEAIDCLILRSLYVDSLDSIKRLESIIQRQSESYQSIQGISEDNARMILRQIAETAAELRGKGYRWAIASTAGLSLKYKIRIAVVHFQMTASEYSNQLESRASALMKQLYRSGRDRRELSLATYLQGTEPTDFVYLYDWLDASTNAAPLPSFVWYWPGMPRMGVEGRIKVVERLFSDHFWSKINTVYASGKGKVHIAFVKDSVGNWGLKNFDNYPGDLLKGYQDIAGAVLESTLRAARDYASAGSGRMIEEGLRLANIAANGSSDSSAITEQMLAKLKVMEAETVARLLAYTNSKENDDRIFRDQILLAQSALEAIPENKRKGSKEESALQHAIDTLKKYREEVLEGVEKILKAYSDRIDYLESEPTTTNVRANTRLLKNR